MMMEWTEGGLKVKVSKPHAVKHPHTAWEPNRGVYCTDKSKTRARIFLIKLYNYILLPTAILRL